MLLRAEPVNTLCTLFLGSYYSAYFFYPYRFSPPCFPSLFPKSSGIAKENKVSDVSKITHFKQNFRPDLQALFDHLVDLTKAVCQTIALPKLL